MEIFKESVGYLVYGKNLIVFFDDFTMPKKKSEHKVEKDNIPLHFWSHEDKRAIVFFGEYCLWLNNHILQLLPCIDVLGIAVRDKETQGFSIETQVKIDKIIVGKILAFSGLYFPEEFYSEELMCDLFD